MAMASRQPFAARRNEKRTFQIQVVGMDLTSVAAASGLRMQVRLRPDTPGSPLIDLATVTNANAEGLRLSGVVTTAGVPTSTITGIINKSTMSSASSVPYAGEAGDDSKLAYALQIDGVTRLFGDFWALANVLDSDSAPTDRAVDFSPQTRAPGQWYTTTLTVADQDVTRVTIDGADMLGPLVQSANEAATQTAADRVATALSAATAEAAAGPTYASTAAGLAATSDGEAFAVDNGDGTVTVYLNDGGSATAQRTLATTDYLASSAGLSAIGTTDGSTAQEAIDARAIRFSSFDDVADGSFGSGTQQLKLDDGRTLLRDDTIDAAAVTAFPTINIRSADGKGWKLRAPRIVVGDTHIDARLEYGLRGNNDPTDTARMQAAVDNAPLGSYLHITNDVYKFTDTINITRQLHVVGHGARISADFTGNTTKDLFKTVITTPAPNGGDVRHYKFSGITASISAGGRDCLRVETSLAGLFNMLIEECNLAVPNDSPAGVALHLVGAPSSFHTIRRNTLTNQLWLDRTSDGTRVEENMILGQKAGIHADVIEGALRTKIADNSITCRDGAIEIRGGSQVYIGRNQMEQAGTNANALASAMCLIYPTSQKIRGVTFEENNFGAGTGVNYNIWAVATAAGVIPAYCDVEDIFINRNTFGRTADSKYDIFLGDAKVRYTRIGPDNRLRGIGANRGNTSWTDQTNGVISANSLDPAELLKVNDAGTGTYGIWQAPSKLALQNGWTAGTIRFRKALNDLLQFDGQFGTGGTLTNNTVIGVLPVGFRPRIASVVRVAYHNGATVGSYFLQIAVDGTISIIGSDLPGTQIRVSDFLPIKGRDSYDPGQ